MNIKNILKKSILPVVSAFVGGLAVIAALKLNPAIAARVDIDLYKHRSDEQIYDAILKKQDALHRQLDRLFDENFSTQIDPFDSWFPNKLDGGTLNDISKREDDAFVYYDIKVDDLNSTSVNTKVENGHVSVNGTFEKKSDSKKKDDGFSTRSIYKSTFNRIFSLPENVDQNKMEMSTEKDKIVLKFPKLNSKNANS